MLIRTGRLLGSGRLFNNFKIKFLHLNHIPEFLPRFSEKWYTEKIESSKRTYWFIIKNKLETTVVVVLIYPNFKALTKLKKSALILGAEIEKRKQGFKYLHLEHNANNEQQMFPFKDSVSV